MSQIKIDYYLLYDISKDTIFMCDHIIKRICD